MNRRVLLNGLALGGALALSNPLRSLAQSAQASETGPSVAYAGIAYLTNFADIERALPYASKLLNAPEAKDLDRELFARATSRPQPFTLSGDLGTLKPGQSAPVLALALDHELTDVERLGGQYKLSVTLWGQVMVFDYGSMSVISSTPLICHYVDLLNRPAEPSDIERAYGRLIHQDDPSGLKQSFVDAVGKTVLPKSGSRSLRVTKSQLGEKAQAQLQDLSKAGAETYASEVAARFSGWLTAQQKISILPPASNQAIGGKMAARLRNGTVYTLKIPQPDYEIHLTLDGFKKVLVSDVAAGKGYVYGAFVTIKVIEPLSNTVFFEQQVRLGVKRTQPATASDVNDGPVYDEALQQLFSEFTRSIDPLDETWTKANVLPADKALNSMKSLRKVIQSCR